MSNASISKSLEEVWSWKEKGYNDVKGLPLDEQLKKISENAKKHTEELYKTARITTRSNR